MPTLVDFLLTPSRIRVIDTETCLHDGVRHVVALAVISVDNGQITGTQSWVLDPQVPIDEISTSIHGITDDDVAGAPTFADVEADITNALTNGGVGDTVWVAHSASFDVRVLFREYTNANVTWPDLPVIDTYTLPAAIGQRPLNRLSLPVLAQRLDIDGLNHHDPVSDATTTAACLLALLGTAHTQGVTDMAGLLAATGNKTTMSLTDNMPDRDEAAAAVRLVQTPEHVGAHLSSVADNTTKSVTAWTRAFLTCARVGCEYTAVMAQMVEDQPLKFFDKLAKSLAKTNPDTLTINTALGAVQPLVAEGAVPKGKVFTWHTHMVGPRVHVCPTDAVRCPDCREGKPCPADVFYQAVGNVLSGRFRTGVVPNTVVNTYATSDKQISSWIRRGGVKVAGYVIWACMEQAAANADKAAVGKLRATVHNHQLDEAEPRLTVQTATRMLADGNRGQADQLVTFVLATATTDPGFVTLRNFQKAHLFTTPARPVKKLKTHPRVGVRVRRPAGRVDTPRFKL